MRRTLILLSGLCVVMSSRVHAQEKPALLINSGATIPTADYGRFHGLGPNFGAALDFELTPRTALQGAVGYYSLPISFQQGKESGLFVMGNLKMLVLPEASFTSPYVLGGLGVWRTGFSDLWVSTDGVSPRPGREGQEEARFAMNFGAGMTVPLNERVGLFGQARYVMVLSDEPSIRMIPLEFGFTFSRR